MPSGMQQALPATTGEGVLRAPAVLHTLYRYCLSTTGPVMVSAAHFAASLIFLHMLQPAEFGQFSFLLIVVPFCLGATGALLGAPAALTRAKDAATAHAEILTLQKVSLVFAGLSGLAVGILMFSAHAQAVAAVMFGIYGAASVLRSFARSLSNVRGQLVRVATSDFLYSALLVSGLAALIVARRLTMPNAAFALCLAAMAGFMPFGLSHIREFVSALRKQTLGLYAPMWKDVTRWSLLGTVLTEFTANAHAYSVTFLSGPKAFGLLALGALFMRPASLVISALPDIDQPLMTRRLAKGDIRGALRVVTEFRTAAFAVLAATILLSFAILTWAPQLLAKKGYDATDVMAVLILWIAITALRALRSPTAVFFQALGNYSALARVSAWSCGTSLIVTVTLLLTLGPIASLGGVLAGEIAIILALFPLMRAWRRHNA